jgi:hypothetical protein
MNKKSVIFFCVLLVAIIGLFLIKNKKIKPDESAKTITTNEETKTMQGRLQAVKVLIEHYKSVAEVEKDIQATPDPAYTRFYLKQQQLDPAFDWKQPINFYGIVVDEGDRPLAGAHVDFAWNDLSEAGTSKTNTESDAAGLFALINKKGKCLSAIVRKEGYYTLPSQRSANFEYADPFRGRITPDPNNPIIFHLLKKGQVDQLYVNRIRRRIPQDDTPVGYDPINNKTNSQGPLIFNFLAGRPDEYFHADMRLRIMVNGGGIQPATGEFPFLAPTDGYQPSIEFSLPKDARQGFVAQYYFYMNEPRIYGRLQVHIPGYHKSGMSQLSYNYWVNPNGSQNLKFDPESLGEP